MLKNKKIMLAVALPVLLLAAYTMTKPKKAAPKMKVAGTIYQMPQSFLLNLSDGRYAKVSVALELAPGQSDGATAGASTSSSGESSPGRSRRNRSCAKSSPTVSPTRPVKP